MCKKVLAIILVLMLMLFPATTASANELSQAIDEEITLFYAYTSSTTTMLSISSSGVATSVGSIIGYQGLTTSIDIYLYLQQYKNGSWVTIGSWYQYFNKNQGTASSTMNVQKGYQYRVRASYFANSGYLFENIVVNTPTKTY